MESTPLLQRNPPRPTPPTCGTRADSGDVLSADGTAPGPARLRRGQGRKARLGCRGPLLCVGCVPLPTHRRRPGTPSGRSLGRGGSSGKSRVYSVLGLLTPVTLPLVVRDGPRSPVRRRTL